MTACASIESSRPKIAGYSRSQIQRLIEDGHVSLPRVKTRQVEHRGSRGRRHRRRRFRQPVAATPAAEAIPLESSIRTATSSSSTSRPGMVVHPGAGHEGGTLVNALLHHVTDLSGIGGELRPGIVHRLDKGTSGVMVVAKHDAAHQELARQFHDREVEKVVCGAGLGPGAAAQADRHADRTRSGAPREDLDSRAARAFGRHPSDVGASHPGPVVAAHCDPHGPHAPDSRPPERDRASRSSAIRSTAASIAACRIICAPCSARRGRSCTPSDWRSLTREPANGWSSWRRCRRTCAERSKRWSRSCSTMLEAEHGRSPMETDDEHDGRG